MKTVVARNLNCAVAESLVAFGPASFRETERATEEGASSMLESGTPLVVWVERPTERVVLNAKINANPFEQLVGGLRTIAHAIPREVYREIAKQVLGRWLYRVAIDELAITIHFRGCPETKALDLDLHVLRGNLRYLFPATVSMFSLLQEIVASSIGYSPGRMLVTVASLFMEKGDEGLLDLGVANPNDFYSQPYFPAPIVGLKTNVWLRELDLLLKTEGEAENLNDPWLANTFRPMLRTWVRLLADKTPARFAEARDGLRFVGCSDWKVAASAWLDWTEESERIAQDLG